MWLRDLLRPRRWVLLKTFTSSTTFWDSLRPQADMPNSVDYYAAAVEEDEEGRMRARPLRGGKNSSAYAQAVIWMGEEAERRRATKP